MTKGSGSHDSSGKKRKVSGPNGTCGSRRFVGFSINMIMNYVSGIGSCAEKGASQCSVGSLGNELQMDFFELFELDTICNQHVYARPESL